MISTRHLILRKLSKATPQQVRWLSDPDVMRFSEQRHQSHTLRSQLHYVTAFPGHLFGIHLLETGEHIGNLGAMIDAPNRLADVGILIGERAHWGKGLGLEAWTAACNWLLDRDQGGLRKLEAGCMKTNAAMLKIIRKTGFVQEGERLNHFLQDGNPVSAVLFGRGK